MADTDVLHMDMMGSHLVILSDDGVAVDLLEQRSLVYIDRVRMHTHVPSRVFCLPQSPASLGFLW